MKSLLAAYRIKNDDTKKVEQIGSVECHSAIELAKTIIGLSENEAIYDIDVVESIDQYDVPSGLISHPY